MGHGQIAEGKVRVSIVIPKELKAQLEVLASADNRSVNNYIVTVLLSAVQRQDVMTVTRPTTPPDHA